MNVSAYRIRERGDDAAHVQLNAYFSVLIMRSSHSATSSPHGTPADEKVRQETQQIAREIAVRDAFLEALDPILVNKPAPFEFRGSVRKDVALLVLKWIARDVMPDLHDRFSAELENGTAPTDIVSGLVPEILTAAKKITEAAKSDRAVDQRLTVQVGGDEVRSQLDRVLFALRSKKLIEKAQAFGRATNSLTDERALGLALQSIPLEQKGQASMLMHALVGQSATPGRLVAAAVSIVGRTDETSIKGAGFGSLVDAMFAHAQNQLATLAARFGTFSDVDLVCRGMDRFHRLMRGVNSYVEFTRNGQWSMISSELTKSASLSVENRLKTVVSDLSFCLRRPGGQGDGIDADQWLTALNGMYLLVAVRDARESLALNALVDQVWRDSGQVLEAIIERNMGAFKKDPGNKALSQRLDYATKMARVRFGDEYADILDKAQKSHDRRAAS